MIWLIVLVALGLSAAAVHVALWTHRLRRFCRELGDATGLEARRGGSGARLVGERAGVPVEIWLSPWWTTRATCFHGFWVGQRGLIGRAGHRSIVSARFASEGASPPYPGCEVVQLGVGTGLVCHRSPHDDAERVRRALDHPRVAETARALLDAGAMEAAVFGGRVYVPSSAGALDVPTFVRELDLAVAFWRAIVHDGSPYR